MPRKRRTRRPNNAGSVFYRADRQKWIAQVSTPNGLRTRTTATQDAAMIALAEMIDEETERRRQEEDALTGRQLLWVYLDGWLKDKLLREELSEWSFVNYRTRLQLISDRLPDARLYELTPALCQAILDGLIREHYSPSTINAVHTDWKQALRDAVDLGLIDRNPLERVRPPRVRKSRPVFLEDHAAAKLLAVSAGTRWYAMWAIEITMATRGGEVRAVKWHDVDWRRGTLTIDETVTLKLGGGQRLKEPKTESSNRTLHMGPLVAAALVEHRSIIQSERLPIGEDDLIFPSVHGKLLRQGMLGVALARDCARAGIPRMTPHQLRHTAASSHLAAGVPLKVVQEMLGHSNAQTTLDRYAHTIPGMHRAAMEEMDERLKRSLDRATEPLRLDAAVDGTTVQAGN